MKPLFEVGEEVLLVSSGLPQACVIIDVVPNSGGFHCPHCGALRQNLGYGYGYTLDISRCGGSKDSYTHSYGEAELRKKHKPSEYDFNQLIEEINGLVTV